MKIVKEQMYFTFPRASSGGASASKNDAPAKALWIGSGADALLVPVADVLYFMADKKYIVALTRSQTYRLEDSLDRLGYQLEHEFVRTHRKYLVRVSAIQSIVRVGASKFIELAGLTDTIPVSRRDAAVVRQRMRARLL
jgi:DNA-binding LytR/AlgR family response regulator